MKQKISICFPAYNESKNIKKLIQETLAYLKKTAQDWEIIIVDDASTDNTASIVNSFSGKEPRIRLINHKNNLGYTGAMNTALKKAAGNIIFFIDSDRQYKIKDIDAFIKKINKGYDLVVGIRKKINDSRLRVLLSKCYNLLFRLLFWINEKDVDCGMRAFRKKCAKQAKFQYNPVGAEQFVKARKLKWKVARVWIDHLKRVSGKSHFSSIRLPIKLLKIFAQMLKLRIENI